MISKIQGEDDLLIINLLFVFLEVSQGTETHNKILGQCNERSDVSKENASKQSAIVHQEEPHKNVPLRMLMNPCGQVRDFNSARDTVNTETGLLSPNNCAEVVSALQLHKGKGTVH